ncbi:hypothetical protein [Histidinibacterium aquaticum]|uniref:DUF4056 domain-containing protein n=1 Tax=Histidinibacterium aquaticum TaxID=2613962 RepID=A0A5J5GPN2_9RHOB|nr:hypothetical protein [Histidinibacterium aquaticum]KAA9010015.1 hypothetical protein F3S47_01800 [Histidinibacterium aquaticum]
MRHVASFGLGFGLALLFAWPAQAQGIGSYAFVCPAPEAPEIYDEKACGEYPDHQWMMQGIRQRVEDATTFMTDLGADFPSFAPRDTRDGPAQEFWLSPGQTGDELVIYESGALGFGPGSDLVQLDANETLLAYITPALWQYATDTKTMVPPNDCGAWLYRVVINGMSHYNLERVKGVGLIERLSREGDGAPLLPKWDTSLHIPEGRGQSDRIIDNRISVACGDDPVNGQSSFRDDLLFGRWAVFYDQLYRVIAGENADEAQRMELAMFLLQSVPGFYDDIAGAAAPRRGVVVAFHQVLQGFHEEGLTHFYPSVIARFVDPARPELAQLPVFDDPEFIDVGIGETHVFLDQRVAPLATNAYALTLAPPQRTGTLAPPCGRCRSSTGV